jgi:hypothetical protein
MGTGVYFHGGEMASAEVKSYSPKRFHSVVLN